MLYVNKGLAAGVYLHLLSLQGRLGDIHSCIPTHNLRLRNKDTLIFQSVGICIKSLSLLIHWVNFSVSSLTLNVISKKKSHLSALETCSLQTLSLILLLNLPFPLFFLILSLYPHFKYLLIKSMSTLLHV